MMNRFLSFLFCSAIFFLSGCSVESSDNNTQPSALISVYALSPETPSLNVFANDANIATSVPFGSYTLYNQVAAGATKLKVQTPSQSTTSELDFTTTAGTYYSVFFIDSAGGHLKPLVLRDSITAPADSVYLRFFNFSPDVPSVDIYSYSDSSNHKTLWTNRSYDSTAPANTFVAAKTGYYNFYVLNSASPHKDTLARFTSRNFTSAGYYTVLLEGNYKNATGDTTLQLGIRPH